MKESISRTAEASTQTEAQEGELQFKRDILGLPVQHQLNALKPALPVQFAGDAGNTQAVHQAASRGVSGAATQLPHLKAIQHSFGHHDVSGVNAHVGGPATKANEQMGSLAYATGNSVAFKASPDLHTAAHEAAHVVQQRAGVSLKGGVGQVGDSYEQHADAVADQVVQGKSASGLLDQFATPGQASSGVQAKVQMLAESPNWSELSWSDLSGEQKKNWGVLGWNAQRWDTNNGPPSESKTWKELNETERNAATQLGYSETKWDKEDTSETSDSALKTFRSAVAITNVQIRAINQGLTKLPQGVKYAEAAAKASPYFSKFLTNLKAAGPTLAKAGKITTVVIALHKMATAKNGDEFVSALGDAAVHLAMGSHPALAVLDGVLTAVFGPDWPSKSVKGTMKLLIRGGFGQEDAETGMGMIDYCWVARAVIPDTWTDARTFILSPNGAPAWFRDLYGEHGPALAERLDGDTQAKATLRPRFERIAAVGRALELNPEVPATYADLNTDLDAIASALRSV